MRRRSAHKGLWWGVWVVILIEECQGQCHMIWSCFHRCRVDDADSFFHVTSFTRNHVCNLASRFPYLVHKVFLAERIHAHHGLLATRWIVVSSGIWWFCSRVYGCCETCVRREMPCSGIFSSCKLWTLLFPKLCVKQVCHVECPRSGSERNQTS